MQLIAAPGDLASHAEHCEQRCAVVEEVRGDAILEVQRAPPQTVEHHAGTRSHAQVRQFLGAAPGDHVYVAPVHRAREHVGALRRLAGSMHAAVGQHAVEYRLAGQDLYRTDAEAHRLGAAERHYAQGTVGLDALDDHGDLVEVREQPHRGPPRLLARQVRRADARDQVAGGIAADLVATALEFPLADGPDLVFLATGATCQQEFLEQGAVFFAHASGRPFFQARFQLFLVLLHGLAELLEGGGVEQLPGAWE
ncbi:Uncharacterised protein [Pseudomonas aeruginosa]|nr:Uncharacterised protein [Pseudomonas aeruginosa]